VHEDVQYIQNKTTLIFLIIVVNVNLVKHF
jgi:hypothetical protein